MFYSTFTENIKGYSLERCKRLSCCLNSCTTRCRSCKYLLFQPAFPHSGNCKSNDLYVCRFFSCPGCTYTGYLSSIFLWCHSFIENYRCYGRIYNIYCPSSGKSAFCFYKSGQTSSFFYIILLWCHLFHLQYTSKLQALEELF
ncbi:MAG: hypothetical protein BWY64_04011 [bacterium ADurb.Bin363]|nr:MAG: hypothetical protein BWY64_04011 [bacterium ADurb.Bin363]